MNNSAFSPLVDVLLKPFDCNLIKNLLALFEAGLEMIVANEMGVSYVIFTVPTPSIRFKTFISSYLYKKKIQYSLFQQTAATSLLVRTAIVETFSNSFRWGGWMGSKNELFYPKLNVSVVRSSINHRLQTSCHLWELRPSYWV